MTSLEHAEALTPTTAEVSSIAGSNFPSSRESIGQADTRLPEAPGGTPEPGIYFADNEITLSDINKQKLRQHAEYLKKNPKRVIVFRAYLDQVGSRTFALAVVQNRLDLVVDALRDQGIPKSRIRQVMLGQRGNKPTCITPSCQGRERRIEVLYK